MVLSAAGRGFSLRGRRGHNFRQAGVPPLPRRALCAQQPSETGATFPTDAQLIEIARRAAVYGTVPEFIKSGQYVDTVGTWPQIPWGGLVPCARDTVELHHSHETRLV